MQLVTVGLLSVVALKTFFLNLQILMMLLNASTKPGESISLMPEVEIAFGLGATISAWVDSADGYLASGSFVGVGCLLVTIASYVLMYVSYFPIAWFVKRRAARKA